MSGKAKKFISIRGIQYVIVEGQRPYVWIGYLVEGSYIGTIENARDARRLASLLEAYASKMDAQAARRKAKS